MKKFFTFLFAILLILPATGQKYYGTPADNGSRTLVLMNPTERNFQTFFNLVEKGLLDLPADYHIVGFYNTFQQGNFERSQEYINELNRGDVFFHVSTDSIFGDLYAANAITPDFQKVFQGSNAVIFFGGPDIPPNFYNEPTSLLTSITDYYRHAFEISFLYHLLGGSRGDGMKPLLDQKPGYTILAICLGMQSMNVATGGTLVQDIPTEVYNQKSAEEVALANPENRHRDYYSHLGTDGGVFWGSYHSIRFTKTNPILTELNKGSNSKPKVLSIHHQTVGQLGKNLQIIATGMDGRIAEMLAHDKYPNVLGVQFHPEAGLLYDAGAAYRFSPFAAETTSYLQMYSGDKGETFNRNIWKWFGDRLK